MENGGLLGESKKDIHDILPTGHYPRSLHFSHTATAEMVTLEINKAGLSFPLIGKPDIGGKGRGVKLLKDEKEVIHYAHKVLLDYHIQEYIDYPNEVGIFYYRYPDSEKGKISGIVSKQFLTVTGNGKSSLAELLRADTRSMMYLKNLEVMHMDQLNEIIPAGLKRLLSPYGNHARGAKFIDDTRLRDDELETTIDQISKSIPGFYFGRFDIRFQSWDKLKKGKEFVIIELNGAGAEPTHIYDPAHSLFFALKEIIRHWDIMARISRMNHRKGIRYLNFRQGVKMFRDEKTYSELLDVMAEQIQ